MVQMYTVNRQGNWMLSAVLLLLVSKINKPYMTTVFEERIKCLFIYNCFLKKKIHFKGSKCMNCDR